MSNIVIFVFLDGAESVYWFSHSFLSFKNVLKPSPGLFKFESAFLSFSPVSLVLPY